MMFCSSLIQNVPEAEDTASPVQGARDAWSLDWEFA